MTDPSNLKRGSGRRVGRAFYATVWASLYDSPATSVEVSARTGVSDQRCREMLWAMVHQRLLSVPEWIRPPENDRGLSVPRFVVGDGTVAPYPGRMGARRRAGFARSSVGFRPELIATAYMLRGLAEGMTVPQLREVTGGAKCRLRECIELLREAKVCFVADWVRPNVCGDWTAVYELGRGKDVPKPKPMTDAEASRAYRRRKRMATLTAQVTGQAANGVRFAPLLRAA